MTNQPKDNAGRIPVKAFLADYRSPMSDREVMAKYSLSAQAFVSLVKTLFTQKTISQADVANRRAVAEQRELAKESQFLAGLHICPYCGHPHPSPFTVCPACGAEVRVPGNVKDALRSVTSSSGDHILVLEELARPSQEQAYEEVDEIEVDDSEDTVEAEEVSIETEDPAPTKRSAVESVRSFLSKTIKRE